MTGILIAVLVPLACLAGWLCMARVLFARWRPYTEPLSCDYSGLGWVHSRHGVWCYQKPGSTIGTAREAAVFAALAALAWPLLLILFGAQRIIMAGSRPSTEEMAAKIARLERELGQ